MYRKAKVIIVNKAGRDFTRITACVLHTVEGTQILAFTVTKRSLMTRLHVLAKPPNASEHPAQREFKLD